MKRNRKKWLLIFLLIGFLGIVAVYNLQNDRNRILRIQIQASEGGILEVLEEIENLEPIKNPIAKVYFHFWRRTFQKRFGTQDEKRKKITSNEHINSIAEIYQDYWIKISKESERIELYDSLLFVDLSAYVKSNNLSDSSEVYIDENPIRSVLDAMEKESFYATSFYLNEVYGMKIWDKQSEKEYTIELPHDTIDVIVVFIENYVLKGTSDFYSMGIIQDGGWVNEHTKTLFCYKDAYRMNTEKFDVSYLKHEANHFVDLDKYPHLKGADLEYRSKLIELMYLKKGIFNTISFFIQGASHENRNNTHSYGIFQLIHELSKELFDVDFETDISTWKTIPVEEINQVAKAIYENNNRLLNADPMVETVI